VIVESGSPSHKGHRYPVEIISHCVWLYHRFPLSFREVEELILERGVVVSYETVRRWCLKFGQTYANALRRRQPGPGDKWHLDEVFIKINNEQKHLWRAVDQDGNILDILVPQGPEQPGREQPPAHQTARTRERAMKGFRSTGAAQRFLSAFSGISPHVRPRRHLMTAPNYRAEMTVRFELWDQVTSIAGLPTTP
jgi:putative transposase